MSTEGGTDIAVTGLGWPMSEAAPAPGGELDAVGWPGEGSVSRETDSERPGYPPQLVGGVEPTDREGEPEGPTGSDHRGGATTTRADDGVSRETAGGPVAQPVRPRSHARVAPEARPRGDEMAAAERVASGSHRRFGAQEGGSESPSPTADLDGHAESAPGVAHPRGVAGVRTAAQIAAVPTAIGGDSSTDLETPLAAATGMALRAQGIDRSNSLPRPPHTRVMVVANQKGGVGKTTTAVNVAAALALYGSRVLLVDLDPQGNASTALGVEHQAGVPSMYDVLVRGVPIADVTQPAEGIANLVCAPATIDLSGAEVELVAMVAREQRLRRAIQAHLASPALQGEARYDYVLIDCPPSLGLLTVNALAAGVEVFIPIQCEYYALEGVSQLVRIVDLVRSQLNPHLVVTTVLLTMYDARTRLSSQVADEVRRHFGPTVLATAIPRSVRISEAPSYSQSVMTYDPGSAGALSYLEAAREIAHTTQRLPTQEAHS